MSFCGKLPFNFKYSESPRKDTMLQNILQTSPETPWKLAPPKLALKGKPHSVLTFSPPKYLPAAPPKSNLCFPPKYLPRQNVPKNISHHLKETFPSETFSLVAQKKNFPLCSFFSFPSSSPPPKPKQKPPSLKDLYSLPEKASSKKHPTLLLKETLLSRWPAPQQPTAFADSSLPGVNLWLAFKNTVLIPW